MLRLLPRIYLTDRKRKKNKNIVQPSSAKLHWLNSGEAKASGSRRLTVWRGYVMSWAMIPPPAPARPLIRASDMVCRENGAPGQLFPGKFAAITVPKTYKVKLIWLLAVAERICPTYIHTYIYLLGGMERTTEVVLGFASRKIKVFERIKVVLLSALSINSYE